MKKLVRVIRLQPGESVLIVVEDKPDPCGGVCILVIIRRHWSSFRQLEVHLLMR